MSQHYLLIKQSPPLHGTIQLVGAKNAVLVIMASVILSNGVSVLENVPQSADVIHMIALLKDLGAIVHFDHNNNKLTIDTTALNAYEVKPDIMNKMRASILAVGPLLGRFGKAKVAFPGGCLLGARPIDYHIQGFKKMGALVETQETSINITLKPYAERPDYTRFILEYPSVGATENIMMFAAIGKGTTEIINAAIEPEVLDLIECLTKMGAQITCKEGQVIEIKAVEKLNPVNHRIIPDRLEAGALLLAAAITKGSINLPQARADHMDVFLDKLAMMGHSIQTGTNKTAQYPLQGIQLTAAQNPIATSFKTGPYPCFPTDLQAPTMAMLCVASGTSAIEETVFENRLLHIKELQKMGAQITQHDQQKATIRGVESLYGSSVIATDIRASCALVLAGLVAQGQTKMTGIHHWRRGYEKLEEKLATMGALIQEVIQE